ncbi:heme ABC exporter, ATP-binding protein CcmA [Salinibacter sp. 10B]|uniref:heme ABC exporter ATP-binding protein CcmA n=1 Tax=Salinibacter sp. 10B TaxID=1923971 RepID=UPI000CF44ABF|nr:heme ABC exporter ATP-binding protein CcmA [Salinibacter sp. 10B]PQJ34218.1 heme ABC exporter, ATP-binding protein CcmA [Salinibacter sp. 10B]
MPTLTADQLGHRYGSLLLFRRLSFTLENQESLAVTGANGAGKSTLLRILAGVLSPKAGHVTLTVDGEATSDATHPLRVGLVAPYLGLYDSLTARENLAFLAKARRLSNADARMEAALDEVGLSDRADDPVAAFSSGMQQRVKYAAALLASPPLLLLDEPSANLDAAGRDMVERVIARQRDRDGMVVVATNRPDEASRHDRALRIEEHR